MPQSNYLIPDEDGATFLVDINAELAAIVSQNSGATEPTTMYAYQYWADTSSGILKQRNAANNAWINIYTLASGNLAQLGGATFTGAINEARGTIAMHATTMDLWAQPNTIDGTGSAVTITAIANAPQAGAKRTLYPITGTVITNGATFAVDGAANYTTAAGDWLEFEAVTTSTYKVHIISAPNSMVLIASATASNSATIDFTAISNTVYNSYLLVCDAVIPATHVTTLRLQVSAGVFIIGTNYTHNHFRFTAVASATDGSVSDTSACIGSSAEPLGTGASQVFYGQVNISNCAYVPNEKHWTSQSSYVSSGAVNIVDIGGGRFVGGSAIDGFRLFMSSGNIASGTFKLYGLKA